MRRPPAASHPLATAAVAGAAAGLLAAVLLLRLEESHLLSVVSLISLPADTWFGGVFESGWSDGRANEMLTLLPLSGALWAVALTDLGRFLRHRPAARWVALGCVLLGTGLAVLVWMVWIPIWDTPGGLQGMIVRAQWWGRMLLEYNGYSSMEYEGSFANEQYRPGPLTFGLFALANTMVLAALACVVAIARRLARRGLRAGRISRLELAAATGSALGLALILLLTDFAVQAAGREDELLYAVGYWAGIPANEWLHAVTRGAWGWEGRERAQFVSLSLMLSGAFWGAAAFGVAGGLKRSRRFRRALAVCAAITLPLATAQWAVGIPGPMGGESRLQDALLITHAPGIFLLQQVGLCCGYFNSTVLRDWGGSYRPSALPMFLLAVSNLVMYLALWYAGMEVWRRMTRRRDRARVAAPVAPG